MTVQLCEDESKTLTDKIWDQWKATGVTNRFLTYIELKHLTEHFLKLCREQNRDPREYDFANLVDSNLNYYENQAEIENELGGLNSIKETEAVNKLKEYLTEEQLAEYTPTEKNVIESIENTSRSLEKKIGQMAKKMETQTIDPEALRHELDDMQKVQSQIYARLEQIPNLPQLVAALEASKNFKKVGEAIRPITPNLLEAKPVLPAPKRKKRSIWSVFNSDVELSFLDKIAVGCTTLVWAGLTYGACSSWGLSWQVGVGMALFWIFYPVAIRIITNGALD